MAIARSHAAAVFGGLAVGVLLGWIRLPALPLHEKVSILVAKVEIPQGTKMTEPETLFEVREFNKGEEPYRGMSQFDGLRDKRVNKTLLPGAAITPDDITYGGMHYSFTPPPGYHCLCIKVGKHEEILAGLKYGSWVDVVLARPTEDGGTKDETLVPKVQVLAVDGIDKTEDGESRPANTLTLQVRREEATKIAAAQQEGEVWVRPVLLVDK
jgi:Flp pilus assembly protein CpaB